MTARARARASMRLMAKTSRGFSATLSTDDSFGTADSAPTSKPVARSTRSASSRAPGADDSSLDELDVVPKMRRRAALDDADEDQEYAPPRARRRMPRQKADVPADPAHTAAIAKAARRAHLKREIGGIALLLGAVFVAGALVAQPAYSSR